ncbi:WxL domain-containing protein [Carnobacterium maltaromaticum]|uniref:WxL domain-containing protein n=1 Tax=Carnobacterium maltaromaticum TaxID=2751 RepID=UPI0012F87E65|nr:WxL domain-containing protein [Carnobacterium maltaromaticum]
MKTVKLTAIGMLAINSLTLGGTAIAADEKTRDVQAQVEFVEATDPVDPVDPLNPEKPVKPVDPVDPEKPVDPGTSGPLSLDYASSLNFGKQKITTDNEIYYAKPQNVEVSKGVFEDKPLYAQITDGRGTLKGWTLSVSQKAQFKTDKGDELEGAVIRFTNGEQASVSLAKPPSVVKSVINVTGKLKGESSKVMAAKEGEAGGTYVYRLGNDKTKESSVALEIPGDTVKKKAIYSTTLIWTLNDTPEPK